MSIEGTLQLLASLLVASKVVIVWSGLVAK